MDTTEPDIRPSSETAVTSHDGRQVARTGPGAEHHGTAGDADGGGRDSEWHIVRGED